MFGVCPRSLARVVCSPRSLGAISSSSRVSSCSSRSFQSLARQTRAIRPSPSALLLSTASSRSFSLWPSSSPPSPSATSPLPPSSIDNSLIAASSKTTPSTPPPSASDSIASLSSSSSPSSPAVNFPASDADLLASSSSPPPAFGVDALSSSSGLDLVDLAQIPMELGDLKAMGLCSWWPTGLIERLLELVHVSSGLPWWATIIATTFLIRAVLFKSFISQARTSGKMLQVQPEMILIQAEMAEAKKTQDQTRVQQAGMRMATLYKKHKINPLTMLGSIVLTIPITISTFLALRKMANLPVPQFLVGGIPGWCENLTEIDPTYILPVTSAAATWMLAHFGQHGAKPETQTDNMIAVSFAMKTASIVALPAISGFTLPVAIPLIGGLGFAGFPAAVLLYWTTTNTFAFLQSYLVQFPAVRRYFDLPPVPRHTRPVGEAVPTGYQAARKWWASKMHEGRAKQLAQEKAHLDRQRKAGVKARERVLDIERLGKGLSDSGSTTRASGSLMKESVELSAPSPSLVTRRTTSPISSSSSPSPRPTITSSSTPLQQQQRRSQSLPKIPTPPPSPTVSKIDALRAKRIALARQIVETEAKAAAAAAAAKEARRAAREAARRG